MGRLFTIRSFWDLFALPALAAWLTVAVSLVALATGAIEAYSWLIVAGYGLSSISVVTPLATVFGSKRHDHLSPGTLYHVAAFFLGPVVGLHYLLRTRDTARAKLPSHGEALS